MGRLRCTVVLLAAALGVHELRYLLAFGGGADGRLVHDGHAYLGWLTPLATVLAVLAAAGLVHRLASGGAAARPPASLARTWAACAATLAAAYTAQELMEGALASGHPAGPAGILGHGGWIGFLCAAALGLLAALALRGAAALGSRAGRFGVARPAARARALLLSLAARARPRFAPLAGGAAGRAPPLFAVR